MSVEDDRSVEQVEDIHGPIARSEQTHGAMTVAAGPNHLLDNPGSLSMNFIGGNYNNSNIAPTQTILQGTFPNATFNIQSETSEKRAVSAVEVLSRYGLPTNLVEMIGRDKEVQKLDELLKEHHRVAIVGMGGLGKTTLAYHYGQRWAEHGNKTILVNSETGESLVSSFRGLAAEIDITNYRDKQPVTLVQNIWKILKTVTVLIIYDNVDRFSTIRDYLPPLSDKNFYMIITSQNQDHSCFNIFKLDILGEEEATKLIKTKLDQRLCNTEEQLIDVKELIKITQGLPLAMLQALSHIKFKGKSLKYSIGSYLINYKNNLLDMKRKHPYLDDSLDPYKKTVYTSVMMNIELMKKDDYFHEDMLKIFHVMTFLNPENIITDLLMALSQTNEDLLHDFISISSKYSLCTQVDMLECVYLNVHRLVLEVSDKLLNATGQHYKSDLLINSAKMIINKCKNLWTWHIHKDFILKHLTVEDFHQTCVSALSEGSHKKQFQEDLIETLQSQIKTKEIQTYIQNLTVYHYGVYLGVIELFNNIQISNNKKHDDVPCEIKSLRQVYEDRKSLTICNNQQRETWISSEDGRLLVTLAENKYYWKLVRRLVNQGASPLDAPDAMFYETDNKDHHLKYFISLLDGDRGISSRYDPNGLIYGSDNNVRQRYISELLHEGGSVNNADKMRTTPLHIAASAGQVDWIHILIDNGADINAVNSCRHTPLFLAVFHNNMECVTALLNRGADVNSIDEHRLTALHNAAFFGLSEYVRVLVEYGARVDVTDEAGKTPLDVARQFNRYQCIKLLSERADDNSAMDTTEDE